MKKFAEVTGKNKDGEEVTVIVKRPRPSQNTDAQIHSSKMFNRAIQEGAVSRAKLRDHLRRQGLWDDTKEKELKEVTDKVTVAERCLANKANEDGSHMTKKEARELAINIRRWRGEQLSLLAAAATGDDKTAEGIAEQARFDYLVSVCIFNEDETPHFKSVDDYLNAADDEGNEYLETAGSEFAQMFWSYDPKAELKRIENRVLIQLGFADEEGNLVNEDGHLVDASGRLINDEGAWVDEDGNLVDADNNRIDEDGNPIGDGRFDDFLDD